MVSIYIHLWDTLAVNYMTLLLYSYIRPVFTKKNQEKPPRNSGILMWNYLCSIMDLSDPSNRSWIILVAVSCSSINTLVEDLVPLWSAVRGRGLVWSERSKEESVLITCVTVSKYLSMYKTTHNQKVSPTGSCVRGLFCERSANVRANETGMRTLWPFWLPNHMTIPPRPPIGVGARRFGSLLTLWAPWHCALFLLVGI